MSGQNIEIVKLQIRRGPEAELPVLDSGEPAITTDTSRVFIGDGTTNHELAKQTDLAVITSDVTNGGLDRVGASSKFVTSMNSYIALVNTMYPSDNGTRFYIVPKAKVTTGVGGVIKLFGDDYQNGADYRDMGWYFSADQQNDKGYFGNGVFWFNQKIYPGGQYDGKNPDIGFSFQDGETVAGRIVRLGAQHPIWVFGSGLPTIHGINPSALVEFQGDVGFKNNIKLNFRNHTNDKDANIRMNSDDFLYVQTWTGVKFFDNGSTETLRLTSSGGVQPQTKLVQNYLAITNNSATPDVSGGNVFVINNSTPTSITDFINATQGQQITLVINDTNTTIVNSANLQLKNGLNYKPATLLSNITLMRLGSSWVEIARTDTRIAQNYLSITNGSATPDISTGNVYIINNTASTSITDFINGIQGQQLTLIINDTNTTIVNGTNIKLKGGTNYRPANLLSNITLMRLGSSWVETARTEL